MPEQRNLLPAFQLSPTDPFLLKDDDLWGFGVCVFLKRFVLLMGLSLLQLGVSQSFAQPALVSADQKRIDEFVQKSALSDDDQGTDPENSSTVGSLNFQLEKRPPLRIDFHSGYLQDPNSLSIVKQDELAEQIGKVSQTLTGTASVVYLKSEDDPETLPPSFENHGVHVETITFSKEQSNAIQRWWKAVYHPHKDSFEVKEAWGSAIVFGTMQAVATGIVMLHKQNIPHELALEYVATVTAISMVCQYHAHTLDNIHSFDYLSRLVTRLVNLTRKKSLYGIDQNKWENSVNKIHSKFLKVEGRTPPFGIQQKKWDEAIIFLRFFAQSTIFEILISQMTNSITHQNSRLHRAKMDLINALGSNSMGAQRKNLLNDEKALNTPFRVFTRAITYTLKAIDVSTKDKILPLASNAGTAAASAYFFHSNATMIETLSFYAGMNFVIWKYPHFVKNSLRVGRNGFYATIKWAGDHVDPHFQWIKKGARSMCNWIMNGTELPASPTDLE